MSNRTPSAYSIPPVRKVSILRQRMIDDMTVRNLAPNTMLCYLKQVHYLARYFGRSPEKLTPDEIGEYQLYRARDRKVSVSSRLVATTPYVFSMASRCNGIASSKCFRHPARNTICL